MAQLDENGQVVAIARASCLAAIGRDDRAVLVAKAASGGLAGFVIAERAEDRPPEIDWLIVAPACKRPGKLHADKEYDFDRCRRACRQRRWAATAG